MVNGHGGSTGPNVLHTALAAALAGVLSAGLATGVAVRPPFGPGEVLAAPTVAERMSPSVETFPYGWSGCGRPLLATRIGPPDSGAGPPGGSNSPTALLVFEVHGYEDRLPRDGRLLVDLARAVIARRAAETAWTLYVVPSSNPDGLADGWTRDGPGRCQVSAGIDVNRDFPVDFSPSLRARNLTGPRPCASPEARALMDLVLAVRPDVVIDFHGWLATSWGETAIGEAFAAEAGLHYSGPRLRGGSFAAWAQSQGCLAALVELPFAPTRDSGAMAEAILRALGRLAAMPALPDVMASPRG